MAASTTSDVAHEAGHGEVDEHGVHEHPSDGTYIRVALVLGVLTAIEVWLSYAGLSSKLTTASLLIFAAVKFAIVALYFMHLKFDSKVLRRLFVTGLVLAIFCYVAYLSTLHVFPLSALAAVNPWAWHAHPDVWFLIAVLGIGYWFLIVRVGPAVDRAGEPVVERRHLRNFAIGLGLLWLGSDWPIHDISEKYLLSVHMSQHLIFTLMAPPMLLVGLPPWLQRRLWGSGVRAALLRVLGRPLVAGLVFNVIFVLSHWPAVVDAALRSEPVHFAVHTVLVLTAALMWFPVLNRQPGLPQMGYPGRMLYLFLQSVLPTVPASFLTFATGVIYKFYEDAPRAFSITAVEDQQLAGAIMKVYGGTVLWLVILVMFFRYYAESQRASSPDAVVLTWDEVQRELERTRAPVER